MGLNVVKRDYSVLKCHYYLSSFILFICHVGVSPFVTDLRQQNSDSFESIALQDHMSNVFVREHYRGFDPGAATVETRRKLLRELCPEISAREILSHRFFNETQSCFETGDKGPCGENMRFLGLGHNTIYGKCDCNYNDFERILVFHQQSKKCYFAFSQGYCELGKWIVFNQDWQPACEPNTCLKQQYEMKSDANNATVDELASEENTPLHPSTISSTFELVPYKGRCVPLGETCQEIDVQTELHGKAQSTRSTHRSSSTPTTKIEAGNTESPQQTHGEIQFVRGRLLPQCVIAHTWRNQEYMLKPLSEIKCIPGSVSHVNRDCQITL